MPVRKKDAGGKRAGRLWHVHHAAKLLASAEARLRLGRANFARIAPAGEFRRGCELISDPCLVAQSADHGDDHGLLVLGNGVKVHLAHRNRYGLALLFATGSPQHIGELRRIAAINGMTLSRRGLRRGRESLPCANEADVYSHLGLPFIEPELREAREEIEWARNACLPELVEAGDIRGILHVHTTASDGCHTLRQMAEASRARNYRYLGVSDHSQSCRGSGGLEPARVLAQQAAIDRLNARYEGRFFILKGIESDILPDGSLDYPDEALARFDFVIASVHSRFGLDRRSQTARIVRAVSNRHTTILGHLTGRRLLRPDGYDVDVEEVLKACAEHEVAVEINATPQRLELDWRWHQTAARLGCRVSINADAHSISDLDSMRWGIAIARKGGIPRERVLNCLTLSELRSLLRARRRQKVRA
jgi:DNA polymerase (family 10)